MIEFSLLRQKEVIDVETGNRLGYVNDLCIEERTGCIHALLLPPKGRLFGFFGKEPPLTIPWEDIIRMGDDVILVHLPTDHAPHREC